MKESVYYQARVVKAVERMEEEKENALQGSRDDFATAMDKYVRAKEVYKAKLKQIEEIESTSAHMKADMDLRKARWRQFRDYISDYSGQKFDETRESFFWPTTTLLMSAFLSYTFALNFIISQHQGIERNN
jgi:hypothetical protein